MLEPLDILTQYWGYPSFRPLQEDIIRAVLEKKDTLALMPTGGGKSICFQVPALCQEGVCIVVSPLIALMKDQVFQLQKRSIPAVAIHSGMHYTDIDRAFDNCIYGNIKLLYLSPERLASEMAIERIKKMHVNLIAVDEAHCISQWGYDFRPSYLEIAAIREWAPDVPILALTATATPEVVEDIQEKLEFKKKHVFQKSFERSNLSYVVLNEEGKYEKLLDILQKVPGTAVVYVRNRRKTKEIATSLRKDRINADFYHAGLTPEMRSAKQDAWINNKIRVIVSTNAFGMGIDKPDVRVVVHMDLPDSLEAYFQEAGRAGRDEKKAYAVLLYQPADKANLERNLKLAFPELKEIKKVYQALGSFFQLAIGSRAGESHDFEIGTFIRNYNLEAIKTFHCLKILEQEGWLTLTDSVLVSASLQFIVDKDQLYDFQLKNKGLDPIIKTILRTYQGIFQHPVHINEGKIANFLGIKRTALTKAFMLMKKEGIVNYHPQKDKPQLTFLEERVDPDNLAINSEKLRFRKERYQYRIEKAIEYAEGDHCRSQFLLQYFGETNALPCGVCDSCLERNKTDLTAKDFERYKMKVEMVLKSGPLTLDQVLEAFSPGKHERIIKVVDYMVDEKMLVSEEGGKLRILTV